MPLLEGDDTDLSGQQVRLTFLHTSDIHSRLVPFDFAPLKTDIDLGLVPEAGPFGGATRLAALIKRERQRGDRVLHLDSGDAFLGEVEFRLLSRLRLDAAAVGNHEFDAGALNFANQARDNATFPLLAANYFWDDYRDLNSHQSAKYTAPYSIKTVRGLRVGIIGMANLSSLNSIVEGGNSLQVTPLEQNEAARAYVELLKPVTDLIVIVSHLGLTEDQELIHGYEAYFEYGRIKGFLTREASPWRILQWYGPVGEDGSVVRVAIPGVSGIDVIMGGHLHVVLNPPQQLTDPSGRQVLLVHSGAFAKYLGRLDMVVQMPPRDGAPEMAEVVSHTFKVFPVDGLWCDDATRAYYRSQFWTTGQFSQLPQVRQAIANCTLQEDQDTTQLLQPYLLSMDFNLGLTNLFAYAPRDIARRNNSTGGDSPLGNIAADSMRKRRRVEAEVALTNSLGIRDNLYAGPLTQEAMYNVFPFENTINVMYLSGVEMQELFDFVAERSSGRGCISQAQVSGARFTMDCAQVQLNDLRFACDPSKTGPAHAEECTQIDPNRGPERAPWQCLADVNGGGRCWAHAGIDIQINGKPLDLNGTYKIAVNDYIAKGGSGFAVLKRNTSRIETGISLRDSLVGYMESFCTCDDLLADRRDEHGNVIGAKGQQCGSLLNGQWAVDPQVMAFCQQTAAFKATLDEPVGACTCRDALRGSNACGDLAGAQQACLGKLAPGPFLGRCNCKDALSGNVARCGNVTAQVKTFCENPTSIAIAVGVEDGRIQRRVK